MTVVVLIGGCLWCEIHTKLRPEVVVGDVAKIFKAPKFSIGPKTCEVPVLMINYTELKHIGALTLSLFI